MTLRTKLAYRVTEPIMFWICCIRGMLHHRLKRHSVIFVIDYAYMMCEENGCDARWDWMWTP